MKNKKKNKNIIKFFFWLYKSEEKEKMQRKFLNPSDKKFKGVLRRMYGVRVISKDRFKNYKSIINTIKREYRYETNREIVNCICDEPENVVYLIELMYDNISTQQCYLSAMKKIFEAQRPGMPNLYEYYMGILRAEIEDEAGINEKMIAFRSIHPDPIEYIEDRKAALERTVNAWCLTHFDMSIEELVNSKTISMGPRYVSDIEKPKGFLKMCSYIMAIVATDLQCAPGRILRAECRETVFMSEGGSSMNNYISIRTKQLHTKWYKTKGEYGVRHFDLSDKTIMMIKYIRLFNGPGKFIFSTSKGTLYDYKALINLYHKIDGNLHPMLYRKIHMRALMCVVEPRGERAPDIRGERLGVFTGNTRAVRQRYYDCESEDEYSEYTDDDE